MWELQRPGIMVGQSFYQASHFVKYTFLNQCVYTEYTLINEGYAINGIDCSHLCHNGQCILAAHLNFELTETNCERELCLSHCRGHGKYPNCIESIFDSKLKFIIIV